MRPTQAAPAGVSHGDCCWQAGPVIHVDSDTVFVVAVPFGVARLLPILMLFISQCAPAVSRTAFNTHVAWTRRCVQLWLSTTASCHVWDRCLCTLWCLQDCSAPVVAPGPHCGPLTGQWLSRSTRPSRPALSSFPKFLSNGVSSSTFFC